MEVPIANDLIDAVARAEGVWLLGLVLLVVLAESTVLLDFVAPGEVGLVVAGAAAAQNGTPVVGVIAAATLAAVAGDSLGYVLGRRYGTALVERGRWKRLLGSGLRRARRHFDRRGGRTVAVARWIGALRGLVPIVAGSAGLAYRQLIAWGAPSALGWSAAMSLIGYLWGDDIASVVDRAGLLVSAAALVLIGVLVWRGSRQSEEEKDVDDAPPERRPVRHPG